MTRILLSLALLPFLLADTGPVRLPDLLPAPAPPPDVSPDQPAKLTAESLYVIDSDVELIVLSSPPGVLNVSGESGPLRIRGKFVDGGGKLETRTFKGKFVYTVDALKTAPAELIIIPHGVTEPREIIRRRIDAEVGPRPPPNPPDPPTPPIPGGLRVLMIEETKNRSKVPPAQLAVIFSKSVRDYMDSKCVTDDLPDGRRWKSYRVYDPDQDISADLPVWRDLMKRPRSSVPWIIITNNGQIAHEGPLPPDVDAALALLKRFGG